MCECLATEGGGMWLCEACARRVLASLSASPDLAPPAAPATAEGERMIEALRRIVWRMPREGESHNDRYERLAEAFNRETRCWAPGKSLPLEMEAVRDLDADTAEWERWCLAPYVAARELLAEIHATPEGEKP